jgi:hypothetical protein
LLTLTLALKVPLGADNDPVTGVFAYPDARTSFGARSSPPMQRFKEEESPRRCVSGTGALVRSSSRLISNGRSIRETITWGMQWQAPFVFAP